MATKRAAPPTLVAYRVDDDLAILSWQPTLPTKRLSDAEREVLALVVEGKSNQEIAAARGTSERTVANQIASLLRKLGAPSRYALIGRGGPT